MNVEKIYGRFVIVEIKEKYGVENKILFKGI